MSMVRDPSFDTRGFLRVLKPGVTLLTEAYIDPVPALSALLAASSGTVLEPPTGTQTSETTRFSRQFIIYRAWDTGTHRVFLYLLGTARIYVGAGTDTWNYRYYIKFQKTRDFTNFVDLTSEAAVFSYTRGPASTAGWYDDGTVHNFMTTSLTLTEGDFLVIHIRGTSWTVNASYSSIGLKSATLPIRFAVIPP